MKAMSPSGSFRSASFEKSRLISPLPEPFDKCFQPADPLLEHFLRILGAQARWSCDEDAGYKAIEHRLDTRSNQLLTLSMQSATGTRPLSVALDLLPSAVIA